MQSTIKMDNPAVRAKMRQLQVKPHLNPCQDRTLLTTELVEEKLQVPHIVAIPKGSLRIGCLHVSSIRAVIWTDWTKWAVLTGDVARIVLTESFKIMRIDRKNAFTPYFYLLHLFIFMYIYLYFIAYEAFLRKFGK